LALNFWADGNGCLFFDDCIIINQQWQPHFSCCIFWRTIFRITLITKSYWCTWYVIGFEWHEIDFYRILIFFNVFYCIIRDPCLSCNFYVFYKALVYLVIFFFYAFYVRLLMLMNLFIGIIILTIFCINSNLWNIFFYVLMSHRQKWMFC
jgi:hypothetical protein